jgi:hypothetical protein
VVCLTLYIALTRKPSIERRCTLTPNSGEKGSVTLRHHGDPATYTVDGRIVSVLDGSANPLSAEFQCELHVNGKDGNWQPKLSNGEWATIILGTIEPIFGPGVLGSAPIGDRLSIRRGKFGWQTAVPDSGVEIRISVRETNESALFRVVRQGNQVSVTEVANA